MGHRSFEKDVGLLVIGVLVKQKMGHRSPEKDVGLLVIDVLVLQ